MLEITPLVKNKLPEDTLVVVAMSGGIDSSTLAAYLHKLKYKVIGITLQLYSSNETSKKNKTCCAGQDIYDAKKVAGTIGFPHYIIDYEKIFYKEVIEDFADTYLNGETPIPCVKCNQTVKFRDLAKVRENLGADVLVTGHYAKLITSTSFPEIHKAKDTKKDQSYFLFSIPKTQLEFIRFPLGDFYKTEVRELARTFNLSIADKPESQDICFVKGRSYKELIQKLRPESTQTGIIEHINGQYLGKHKGIFNYTVGQRQGLEISYHEPLYVVKINKEENKIIVGPKESLRQTIFHINTVNWLGENIIPEEGYKANVKLRSGKETVNALIKNSSSELFKVELLEEANCAVTPGQACVIYDDTRMMGGGWINRN